MSVLTADRYPIDTSEVSGQSKSPNITFAPLNWSAPNPYQGSARISKVYPLVN